MSGEPKLSSRPDTGVPGLLGYLHRLHRLARLVVGLAVMAALLTGCSDNGGAGTDPTAKDDMTPTEQLLSRPTAGEAAEIYKDQLTRVQAALNQLAPNVKWLPGPPGNDGETACQDPFGRIDGSTTFGLGVVGAGAIPDEDWDKAIALTGKVLREDGYDQVSVVVNRPGQHQASFSGRYGAVLTIGGERNTDISVSSGCFLTAEAHQASKAKSER